MASPTSLSLLEARRLYADGFDRREAGALLESGFPEVKARTRSKHLTKVYGPAWQKASGRAKAPHCFYTTTAPPEMMSAEEVRRAEKAIAAPTGRSAENWADTSPWGADVTTCATSSGGRGRSSDGARSVAQQSPQTPAHQPPQQPQPCQQHEPQSRAPPPLCGARVRHWPRKPRSRSPHVSWPADVVGHDKCSATEPRWLAHPHREQLWWTREDIWK